MGRQARFISRREFLSAAAAGAVAAPYVLTSPALGGPAQEPAGDRIGLGFIGCGRKGQLWAYSAARLPQVQYVWLCDVYSRAMEQARHYAERRQKGIKTTKDFREVLADPAVDAVVICTPDHWHGVIANAAVRAGKDVFCESPLSLTVGEAEAMAATAQRYGRIFQAGTHYRSTPAYCEACELVASGALGKVRTVHVQAGPPSRSCFLSAEPVPEGLDWEMWLGPAPWSAHNTMRWSGSTGAYGWRSWRDYSGGSMTAYGSHFLDAVQWALGRDDTGPVEVIPPDGKDVKDLAFRYADGVTVFNGKGEKGAPIEFNGTDGVLGIGTGPRGWQTWPEALAEDTTRPRKRRAYGSPDHLGNFLDCVKTRCKPVSDVTVARRSVTICHLGNIAVWLNRPLKWDPAKQQIVGDPEASRWLDRPRRGPWRL